MQSANFVAIMTILNAIVHRFNDDAVRTNLATLGQPFGTGVGENQFFAGDAKTE